MYMYDIIEFNVLWMNEIFIHFFYISLYKMYLDIITRCGSRKEGCESGVGSVHYTREYETGGPSSCGCGPGISLGGGIGGTAPVVVVVVLVVVVLSLTVVTVPVLEILVFLVVVLSVPVLVLLVPVLV